MIFLGESVCSSTEGLFTNSDTPTSFVLTDFGLSLKQKCSKLLEQDFQDNIFQ